MDSGAIGAGLASLTRAATAASASGDRALESEALLALGTALVHSGRSRDEEAGAKLLQAAALAEELGLGDRARRGSARACLHRGAPGPLRALRAAPRRRGGPGRVRRRAGRDRGDPRDGGRRTRALTAARSGTCADRWTWRSEVTTPGRPRSRSPSWGARTSSAASSTRRGWRSSARSRSLARPTGSASFPGPRPGSPRSTSPPATPNRRGVRSSTPSRSAASSAIHAGRGSRARGSAGSPASTVRPRTALRLLEDARRRAGRVPCAYVWVKAYALAALASAAVELDNRRAGEWVSDLASLAARTGMREFAVRASLLRHAPRRARCRTSRRSFSPARSRTQRFRPSSRRRRPPPDADARADQRSQTRPAELQRGADHPAAEDDVEHGQLAVPAVERQEAADGEQRGRQRRRRPCRRCRP